MKIFARYGYPQVVKFESKESDKVVKLINEMIDDVDTEHVQGRQVVSDIVYGITIGWHEDAVVLGILDSDGTMNYLHIIVYGKESYCIYVDDESDRIRWSRLEMR